MRHSSSTPTVPLTEPSISTRPRSGSGARSNLLQVRSYKVRLSIAGYQDKIAAYKKGDEWFLVGASALASTHILKLEPVSDQLRNLTSNEFFCMRLAEKVKLPADPVKLIHVPEPVLVVTRFDRKITEQGVAGCTSSTAARP